LNTVYTATITTGARDTFGNALASNLVWSFTTGASDPQYATRKTAGPAPEQGEACGPAKKSSNRWETAMKWLRVLKAGLVLLILNRLPALGREKRETQANLSVFTNTITAENVQETLSCC